MKNEHLHSRVNVLIHDKELSLRLYKNNANQISFMHSAKCTTEIKQ